MKHLITGANGFVGRALCRSFAEDGLAFKGGCRGPSTFPEATTMAPLGPEGNWEPVLAGMDVLIHLAARVHVMKDSAQDPLAEFMKVNAIGTERLARQAAQAGIKRFIYLSSIKVNGERTAMERGFRETDEPRPQDPYAVSKLEAERALDRVAAETGLEVVILRPALVYGPGVKGNFRTMLRVLDRGLPLPLGQVVNRRSLIYLGNLVDAIRTCVRHPGAAGRTYLVSDGEDLSTPELLRRAGGALGRPARLLPVPEALLRLGGRLCGQSAAMDRLVGSLVVDMGRIRGELGWRPPHTVAEGLGTTAAWFKGT